MFNKHSMRFAFLVIVVLSAFSLADLVPYEIRSFSYAVSLSIKEVLVFSLPFLVFGIVFRSVSRLQSGNAAKTVVLLIAMVALSNSAAVSSAYFIGTHIASISKTIVLRDQVADGGLVPTYAFHLPPIISSIKAVIAGFMCGIILPKISAQKSDWLSSTLSGMSSFALEKVFAPIIPVFIVGLAFKMQSEHMLHVLRDNTEVVCYMFFAVLTYVVLFYCLGARFIVRKAVSTLKNMLPAALVGFTTMSSLITLPLIMKSTRKDSESPEIVDMAVPAVINIHMLGDCFFIIIMSLVISSMFGGTGHITTSDSISFMLYFLISMFAIVAVPGGGVIVMLPIIEKYLHFSPTMSSLITTMYVLFDPMITVTNVLGNGAFATLFTKVHRLLCREKQVEVVQ
ncbi:dicarboxylate/amino acid:cation symporter [Anaplasma capra]|uniref:dicarboxylate/amino acid:cation symporter n=1 Tax=Anaplasma capra TaxID=1562740 RepID=UPI0021D59CBD|nr:dicarboxylate/amino acid:cation symporter [Anaplasma capra]MCU7611876.1 dicarboxylate/amino acid:cation symporter [Anaplasma capra]